jgi:hypothetical protein
MRSLAIMPQSLGDRQVRSTPPAIDSFQTRAPLAFVRGIGPGDEVGKPSGEALLLDPAAVAFEADYDDAADETAGDGAGHDAVGDEASAPCREGPMGGDDRRCRLFVAAADDLAASLHAQTLVHPTEYFPLRMNPKVYR